MLNNELSNNGILSKRLLELGVFTFSEAIDFIKALPYGRNADRANPNLVLDELKGTCSTKHALLKMIAIEQQINEVRLFLCMFKMNAENTPALTELLNTNDLKHIPEAHCVLEIEGEFLDITNSNSSFEKLKNDVLELVEIQPEQIGEFKVKYHQDYIKSWLVKKTSSFTFQKFWKIREEGIRLLGV